MQSKVLATIIAYTFVPGLSIIGLLIYSWLFGLPSSPVAASGSGDVAECEIVATAGTIDIYYCEPTLGPDFLINSMGFMLNED